MRQQWGCHTAGIKVAPAWAGPWRTVSLKEAHYVIWPLKINRFCGRKKSGRWIIFRFQGGTVVDKNSGVKSLLFFHFLAAALKGNRATPFLGATGAGFFDLQFQTTQFAKKDIALFHFVTDCHDKASFLNFTGWRLTTDRSHPAK